MPSAGVCGPPAHSGGACAAGAAPGHRRAGGDDGLQHLALARDIDICIFNAQGTGNGFLLPAGPLREPWPRPWTGCFTRATPARLPPLVATRAAQGSSLCRPPPGRPCRGGRWHSRCAEHPAWPPLHAVAAIGQPGAFCHAGEAGLTLAQAEALPDHYDFDSWSRLSGNAEVLICTEKRRRQTVEKHPDALAVPLELALDARFCKA